ncbi:hypothetical protein GCM10010873_10470 [Cypionkella aquatica]|uniref:DUF1800 domain-containing protein n=1 Tax=Cypionkella aquatica TaxID=1756042 RepID=A0AA37WZ51_9RHOB|nr:DUF1800 domain-containing protein [Cypionkella aquatica]GLS86073.1 hypothetical protein GCM10010873_10470 [Cypionkella aquatica]
MASRATLAATRFGYGLPLPATAPDGPAEMLERLGGPDAAAAQWPIAGHAPFLAILAEMRAARMAVKDRKDPAFVAGQEVLKQQALQLAQNAEVQTIVRAAISPDSLRERLVAFWADHFSVVAARKIEAILPFAMIEDAVRPNLSLPFGEMLVAVSLHPAMLIYLDQSSSIGPKSRLGSKQGKGLNENLAREVIELHSLGVGAAYSQADVTELARLLTGVTVGPKGEMIFDDRKAEPGPKTVLGKTYAAGGLDDVRAALRDLALHDGTAQHLAHKLVVHFVSDTPDADLVASVAAAYAASGGDLMVTYTALLDHPAAWVEATAKARQPFDFLVASVRALGVSDQAMQALPYKQFRTYFLAAMATLGQPFKRPLGPNGFPEEAEEWITPQGLARRITWAMQVPQRLVDPLPDPVAMAESCLADRASAGLLWAAARAEDRTQGVGLVLASAEFNRR